MPNRDYAARSRSKKSGNKVLILAIIVLLLMGSGLTLWFLKESSPTTLPTQTVQTQQPKSSLPTPPEEVYSYIRDLETREVPVDKNSKLAQLTKEQEKAIQKQKEEQLRLEQQAAQKTDVSTTSLAVGNSETATKVETSPTVDSQSQVVALTPEELAEKKAKEQKLAEEKRKQAELKKQQEAAKKAEQATVSTVKQEPAKIVATAKPASEAPKSAGKFGLQCGAFKNKAQAENMQARLAMAGYNARISSNGEWNRVFVGPVGDRAAASSAQSNARSVAECLIIGM
ncbi:MULTISPECIES: cell division protein FtsN [Glaesserella]|uniref:Cell division protein FtsN n=1 Tax=Glaesserella australis TaxID=2094024 RepID=A0A328C101_9PAST|nr:MULTISPECIES: cell division protein FtsN [Glaesserella]AUI66915.1 cell division protein FtsN [Glaesserella sp. 15-184]RAL19521.1 cell division protein FtsN [Glaesserella australis]